MFTDPHTNNLLNQLLVDWDDLVDKNYNPIMNALKLNDPDSQKATEFRNFYHKIDLQMNEVIKNKHKGFNDSIQMYSDLISFYRKFDNLVNSMQKEINWTNELMEMNSKKLEDDEISLQKQKESHILINSIYELYQQYAVFDIKLEKKEFDFCTHTIISVLNSNLDDFGAIQEMKHSLHKKRKKLIKEMCINVNQYIFKGINIENSFQYNHVNEEKLDYRQILGLIVQIDGLLELDEYLYNNIQTCFFNEINKIINLERSLIRIFANIVQLLLAIMNKIKILKNLLNLKDEENFYGEKYTKFKLFCEKGEENAFECLKNELIRFVYDYSSVHNPSSLGFHLSNLEDNVDYASLFENKFKIHEKMIRVNHNSSYYGSFKLIKKPSLKNIFLFNDVLVNEIEMIRSNDLFQDEIRESLVDLRLDAHNKSETKTHNFTKDSQHNLRNSHIKYLNEIQECIKKQIKIQINIKDHLIKKNVNKLFKSKNLLNIDTRNNRLTIFTEFLKIFKPFKKRIIFLSNFFWAFEHLTTQFLHWFPNFYNSEIIQFSIKENEKFLNEQEAMDKFKKQILVKTIHLNDLSIKKEELNKKFLMITGLLEIKSFFNENMHEFNKTGKNIKGNSIFQKIIKTEQIFSTALSLEIYLLLIHFIEEILQNIDENTVELYKILLMLKNCLETNIINNTPNDEFNIVNNLPSILNYYIIKSANNLKIKDQNDLKNIIKKLLMIEEIIYSIGWEFEEGFDESLNFFDSVIQNKCKTADAKSLRMKIF